MNQSEIKITRRELYELVWTTPVTQLAKQYGFSDVWLAKICRRNNIPRPPRGYWAQRQSGKKVLKQPLPPKNIDSTIHINIKPFNSERRETVSHKASSIRPLLKSIIFPKVPLTPHPLIEQSAKILASCTPDNRGILIPPNGLLDIKVSRESLARALNIMDTLINILASLDFNVSVSYKSTNVNLYNTSIGISIGEELYRSRLRAQDHKLDGYYNFGFNQFASQPVPSGKLFLTISDLGFYSSGECRRTWRDTESKRLEDCLKSFVSGLIKAAVLKKEKMSLKER
jgi:hypothetical protein